MLTKILSLSCHYLFPNIKLDLVNAIQANVIFCNNPFFTWQVGATSLVIDGKYVSLVPVKADAQRPSSDALIFIVPSLLHSDHRSQNQGDSVIILKSR